MSRSKERLDRLLVERGLVETRSRAQALIRAGEVRVDGQPFDKPGMPVRREALIEIRQRLPYVGRGGAKLAAALEAFGIEPTGRTCLDVGASTGGFTDCLLQQGARRVYAVDVGRAQLAWSLRQDSRVVNLERHDIRGIESLPEPMELAVIDVSFISLRLVLEPLRRLLAPGAPVIALVKPQFEAGRDRIGKGGVVRDAGVHAEVLEGLLAWADRRGWIVAGSIASPIEGASGNREFLAILRDGGDAPAPGGAERIAAALRGAGLAPAKPDGEG